MPDLQPPTPPAAQGLLRQRLEHLFANLNLTDYRHQDRFWESTNGREAVYGWGTIVHRPATGEPVHVWFDGLDDDIAINIEGTGRRLRREPGLWHEWRDLTELDDVLNGVIETLRHILTTGWS